MKGFYHIWAWRPSWSCDLDFLYTHWFPLPIDASFKIWLWLAKRFQRRRSLKLWTDGRTTDGRTDDGRTPDHGHPISSPCEPNGSGELKKKGSRKNLSPNLRQAACSTTEIKSCRSLRVIELLKTLQVLSSKVSYPNNTVPFIRRLPDQYPMHIILP